MRCFSTVFFSPSLPNSTRSHNHKCIRSEWVFIHLFSWEFDWIFINFVRFSYFSWLQTTFWRLSQLSIFQNKYIIRIFCLSSVAFRAIAPAAVLAAVLAAVSATVSLLLHQLQSFYKWFMYSSAPQNVCPSCWNIIILCTCWDEYCFRHHPFEFSLFPLEYFP